jgi:hypothetical protein
MMTVNNSGNFLIREMFSIQKNIQNKKFNPKFLFSFRLRVTLMTTGTIIMDRRIVVPY